MTPEEIKIEKKCSTCKTVKPINEFNKHIKSKDGYNWQCQLCQREAAKKYNQSEKGIATRRKYTKEYYKTHTKKIWNRSLEYKKRYPDKVEARKLLGQAIRLGYMPAPNSNKRWWDKIEFHHPDHTRPYYGCWVTPSDHRKIDCGLLQCPECIDYEPVVRENLLKSWGLSPSAAICDAAVPALKAQKE